MHRFTSSTASGSSGSAGRPADASNSAGGATQRQKKGTAGTTVPPFLALDRQMLGSSVEQPGTHLSSVEQPAQCNLTPEVWTFVAAFVGSHEPVVDPYTQLPVLWTPKHHYRFCGQSCPCCRAEHAEILGSCEDCEDLWQMKCACTEFKILLQAYGTQC